MFSTSGLAKLQIFEKCSFLVMLFLIIPVPSLSSMSFLSLLNMSPSISPWLIQYVWSLPIPNWWGSTDYLNTHKLIMVIADDMAKGARDTTPEICLSAMTDFVVVPQGVELHSYVVIADGHKGHKMA